MSEFGVTGKVMKLPRVFAGTAMGATMLKQPSIVPQLVVLTYTVVVGVVPLGATNMLTTFSG
jgi:hypothetical protein